MILALFDFDGTLTKRDTLLLFPLFVVGRRKFIVGLIKLLPILGLYKIGFLSNERAKNIYLREFFKGLRKKI